MQSPERHLKTPRASVHYASLPPDVNATKREIFKTKVHLPVSITDMSGRKCKNRKMWRKEILIHAAAFHVKVGVNRFLMYVQFHFFLNLMSLLTAHPAPRRGSWERGWRTATKPGLWSLGYCGIPGQPDDGPGLGALSRARCGVSPTCSRSSINPGWLSGEPLLEGARRQALRPHRKVVALGFAGAGLGRQRPLLLLLGCAP